MPLLEQKEKMLLIGGPCMMEDLDMMRVVAEKMKKLTEKYNFFYIFKSSFDKANRTSVSSVRGPGLEEGLRMMEVIKKEFELPVLTDIHTPEQVKAVADVIDVAQLPAFLARQTDFYIEAAKVNLALNVKKGQFMSPYEMETAVTKYKESGGTDIAVTERGTFFGYGNLIVDFRSIQIIKETTGVPYIFDATHSVQLPAARGQASGGQRQFIPMLINAQLAAGADGLFTELHPDVDNAKSDKETQWPLDKAEELVA